MSVEDKTTDAINNICTILGGALLLYPIINEVTKNAIPEMQKLTSNDSIGQLISSQPEQIEPVQTPVPQPPQYTQPLQPQQQPKYTQQQGKYQEHPKEQGYRTYSE